MMATTLQGRRAAREVSSRADAVSDPCATGCAGKVLDLDVSGLVKSFATKTILRGVTLAIPRGQAVAVIGSNGAGKSTFLRCCMRLIEPDAGTITLLGQDVTHLSRGALRPVRSRVGFVFQRHNLVGRLSALSNVLHGLQARRSGPRTWYQILARAEDRDEALYCLERVGLAHLAHQRVDSLSGGQSQRVAIARALMQRPTFVMADDVAGREKFPENHAKNHHEFPFAK